MNSDRISSPVRRLLGIGFLAMALTLGGLTHLPLALAALAEPLPDSRSLDSKPDPEPVGSTQAEAQDSAPVQTPEETPSHPQKTSDTTKQPAEQVGDQTPDIFVPSEDISEDLAVAFPVDI